MPSAEGATHQDGGSVDAGAVAVADVQMATVDDAGAGHTREAGELVDGHCPPPRDGESESYGCPKGATCDGPDVNACYSCVTNAMQHQICKLN